MSKISRSINKTRDGEYSIIKRMDTLKTDTTMMNMEDSTYKNIDDHIMLNN
jgi:hypothetical protein